jgi:hypothetical protein
MAYSIDQTNAVAMQLEKFTTAYAHHLVGHVANLDFWLEEALHALKVLDEYPSRFVRLRDAQVGWVKAHGTKVSGFCGICGGKCEFDPRTPPPPNRLPSQEIDEARRRLKDAVYKFLLRCHRAGHLEEPALRAACERVGTSVDPSDLKSDAG